MGHLRSDCPKLHKLYPFCRLVHEGDNLCMGSANEDKAEHIELLHITSRIMWQPEVVYNWKCRAMVVCVVVGCSKLSKHDRDVSFCRIPKIIINRGEDTRMLSEKRGNGYVAAISKRDINYRKKFSSWQNLLDTTCL